MARKKKRCALGVNKRTGACLKHPRKRKARARRAASRTVRASGARTRVYTRTVKQRTRTEPYAAGGRTRAYGTKLFRG